MLSMATSVGFGVTGVMLFMFTTGEPETVRGGSGDGRDL